MFFSDVDLPAFARLLTVHFLRILAILIVAFLALRLLNWLTRRLVRHLKEMDEIDGSTQDRQIDTIFTVVRSTGLVVIIASALFMVLLEVGVNVGPMLTSVGIVGLALGLGAQTLVKDVVSGVFIMAENLYRVGEAVEVGGYAGTIEHFTLRATTVRAFNGTLYTIPNGDIRAVSNSSRDWSRAIVDVGLQYETDVPQAMDTLREIGRALGQNEELAPALLDEPTITGIENLGDWQVTLRIFVTTLPGQQFDVQRYLRQEVKKRLALAYPRQEIQIIS
ncbi:MAG: mechanosensitive ion channel family protein [Ardenticatenales bacterium]|nr:mechanosensitive ion channel family protein [Ardenticatenales bacterium]